MGLQLNCEACLCCAMLIWAIQLELSLKIESEQNSIQSCNWVQPAQHESCHHKSDQYASHKLQSVEQGEEEPNMQTCAASCDDVAEDCCCSNECLFTEVCVQELVCSSLCAGGKSLSQFTMRFEPGILPRASCKALQSQRRASSVEYSLAHTTAERPPKKPGSCCGFCPEIHC